jgi:hypothetical protein
MSETPLAQLIEHARLASERMSAKNPNRDLLRRFAIVTVGLAKRVVELEQQLADKPRIVLP